MRRLLTLTVLALLPALPAPASASPVFVFNGAGWGHAVGMAQYGAYGYAQHGWTYDRILAHYYPGTELGPAPAVRIRVLVASRKDALEITSATRFTVRDAQGPTALAAGSYVLGSDLTLEVDGKPKTLALPARFLPSGSPLQLGGRAYRGSIVVSRSNGGLIAVDAIKLEQYVKGVVADEMAPDWHPEALKAQAVASRTYALASRNPGAAFDVYADTRSQVYGGVAAEDPRTNAAADATKGRIVLYQGKAAWTYFSSSSGGKTAAVQDAWPGAKPLPYLVSVDDPYDDISPYHRWGPLTFTADELAAKLGSLLPAGLTDLKVNLNGSGRVATVTATGSGGTTEIPGSQLRSLLGLRSTWFEIDVVGGLTASPSRVVYGHEVALRGVARGMRRVVLEARPQGERWRPVRTVRVGGNGRFSLAVRPGRTTSYRLRLPTSTGDPLRVAVAPELRLAKAKHALTGVVRPKLNGVAVAIERRARSGWRAVASAPVGDGGSFRAKLKPAPGRYRARVPATPGLVRATSPTLTIRAG